jgi:quercetin dioxygenase-like cupin family protein
MTVAFARLEGLPERQMMPGVHLRILAGDALMFSIVRFDPHATVPTHQHPHEQIGFVLEGELDLWVNGARRTLSRGDLYTIPGNVPHGAETHAGTCTVVDVFHPLREEYVKLFGG